MSGLESKSFDSPDEVREFQGNGHVVTGAGRF